MKQSKSHDTLLILPALCALLVLAFAFQGSRGIFSPDEGYYVGVAHSMVRTGDYLIPRLGSNPWLDKPPLTFWGIASGLHLLGQNEWGARAFHALCFILTTLLVSALARSLFGVQYTIRAGVVYATMLLPFVAANAVTPDTPLTLATTAACYCFWRSLGAAGWRAGLWKTIMCTAFGLAFLAKGPAALIPAAALFAFLLFRRQLPGYFLGLWTPVGLMLFCLVGLGWYIYVALEFPTALEYFWSNQVVGRTISTEMARNPGFRGALIYLPVCLVGTLPWSATWWPALWKGRRRLFHASRWRRRLGHPVHLFLGTWIAIPLLVFLLASSRLPLYVLPVFPALALATSWCIFSRTGDRSSASNSSGFSMAKTGLLILWAVVLIGIKLLAAHMSSEQDMRALYASMEAHLPQDGNYEIVSVQEHLEGLAFYNPHPVKRVTLDRKPYPFFVPPEHLEDEVGRMASSTSDHVFVCRGEGDARRVRESLNDLDILFEEISLPLHYLMFVVESAGKSAGNSHQAQTVPDGMSG